MAWLAQAGSLDSVEPGGVVEGAAAAPDWRRAELVVSYLLLLNHITLLQFDILTRSQHE